MMIELVDQRAKRFLCGDEIDDILVFVERSFDFSKYAIVMAVDRFTYVAVKSNKVSGRENELGFLQSNCVLFHNETFPA